MRCACVFDDLKSCPLYGEGLSHSDRWSAVSRLRYTKCGGEVFCAVHFRAIGEAIGREDRPVHWSPSHLTPGTTWRLPKRGLKWGLVGSTVGCFFNGGEAPHPLASRCKSRENEDRGGRSHAAPRPAVNGHVYFRPGPSLSPAHGKVTHTRNTHTHKRGTME